MRGWTWDRLGLREGPLLVPNLASLGLGLAAGLASGRNLLATHHPIIRGKWGCAIERSYGNDTPSGHWEMAGAPVLCNWGQFPATIPCFPRDLTDGLVASCSLTGLLGNKHASGTKIIAELGEEHLHSGKPIIYTSADSVIQIAAHETHFGLERLYEVCSLARQLSKPLNIGRVIARPFVGESRDQVIRTGNRRDYSLPPPSHTLLDHLALAHREVISVGKIAEIFAHRATGTVVKAVGNYDTFDSAVSAVRTLAEGGFAFINFNDFDTLYGHRRDVPGYASALECFDTRIPELEQILQPNDRVIITADHGCDPTWVGTDHTRDCVPVLTFGPGLTPGSIGRRLSFSEIGQSIASHLKVQPLSHGDAWKM
jgi:phosphopentomutase